jgi:hypothetical protein
VVDLSGPGAGGVEGAAARIVFTSGRSPASPLATALARFGIAQ